MKNGAKRQVIGIYWATDGQMMVEWRDHIGDGWCRDYSFCSAATSRIKED